MSEIEIITFGCRLNAYESEVMREHANAAGLTDAVIVNTCAVTGESVRQARQAIRKARRARPNARIVVTGCAAQIDPQAFAGMDEVDHVIGNQEKTEAGSFRGLAVGDSERVKVNDIMSVKETAAHLIEGFGAQARAYVQVQNGCDHRCTFCIIPFGRGPSRSVPAGEVVAQVRKLVANGYAEIVLTGVDITAYGADLPGDLTLGKLAEKILKLVPELKRLRLSSIDSIEACPTLMRLIAEEERLMPHLHLSLQAGDDLILKRMKRRQARADAVAVTESLVSERGSRYIDFVLPGLLAMNLMGSGIWGIGFSIVDARRKKLLKRFVATPMRRYHYLASFLLMRLWLMVIEVTVIASFGYFAFGVPMRGSLAAFAVACLLGALVFGSLGLLVASRARTVEAASGLMNLIMLPMWVASGVFFSAANFPDAVQPFIQALPLTAVVDSVRGIMIQGLGWSALAPEFAVVGAWLAASFGLALRFFRWT